MDDNYSPYRYDRFSPRKKPKLFIVIIVILLLAVLGSVAALYFGGFTFGKGKGDTKQAMVVTPEMTVWLVEVPNFGTKNEAIIQSIAIKSKGGAGYLFPDGEKWRVIEGVYLSSADANREMARDDATETAVSGKYTVNSKNIEVSKNATENAKKIFSQVKSAFDLLVEKRQELADETTEVDDILLLCNSLYTELRETAGELSNINSEVNDPNIADIIYVANQNILALYNVMYANTEITAFTSKLNNAIATLIFSLTFL